MKKLKQQEIFYILLFSILITCLFKDGVNALTMLFIPEKNVIVTAKENDCITILQEDSPNGLFSKCREAASDSSWTYFEGVKGESWTSLSSNMEGAFFSFSAKSVPNTYISFLVNGNGGKASIEVSGGVCQEIDTYSEEPRGQIKRVYPFENSYIKLGLQFFIYSILFCAVAAGMLALNHLLKTKGLCVSGFFIRTVRIYDIFWIWILLYSIAIFHYKIIGIPNYLQIGDENFYWNTLLLQNGKLEITYLASLFSPRGYWCYLFQTIARYTGTFLHMDPVLIWLLFPSSFISWFAVIILPVFLKVIGKREARIIEMASFLLIFLISWFWLLTSVTSDLFGVVTLFASILYMLRYCQERRVRFAVFAGINGAVSCSFRVAYVYGIFAFLILSIYLISKIKGAWKGFLAGIGVFIFMCTLQFVINAERGHLGFLPYDHGQAWYGRPVITWSADYALTTGNIAYPILATDDQMNTMKQALYHTDSPLNMTQLLDVFADSPIESIMLIFKKLIIGFDIKTNVAYPDTVNWRGSLGMAFSFFNYWVLLSGFYMMFSKENITFMEKGVAIILFLSIVLPETFMKIEWRYVITGYIILYYMFSYHFIGEIILNKEKYKKLAEGNTYFPFIVFSVLILFSFSFSFCA